LSARPLDDFSEVHTYRFSHPQRRFQSGIPQAALDITYHLRRKAGCLCNEVFGQLAPLPFLLQQNESLRGQGLGISAHPSFLQKKGIDAEFHYGEIQSCLQRRHCFSPKKICIKNSP
jgi:hypothetical protein